MEAAMYDTTCLPDYRCNVAFSYQVAKDSRDDLLVETSKDN